MVLVVITSLQQQNSLQNQLKEKKVCFAITAGKAWSQEQEAADHTEATVSQEAERDECAAGGRGAPSVYSVHQPMK